MPLTLQHGSTSIQYAFIDHNLTLDLVLVKAEIFMYTGSVASQHGAGIYDILRDAIARQPGIRAKCCPGHRKWQALARAPKGRASSEAQGQNEIFWLTARGRLEI